MWQHAATRRNVEKLRRDGVHIIEPDAGEMACRTIGPGRLSAPERIVSTALELLNDGGSETRPGSSGQDLDLADERILITAGATREPIDPVRFISNRSSGKMAFALAAAARRRGAEVRVVHGIASAPPPSDVKLIPANSAAEMRSEVLREIDNATIFIAAAAVADYRPKARAENKIKKDASELTLELERTPDILSEVASQRRIGQLVVGFAAETENVTANAQRKLHNKKLDMVVANDVSRVDSGFESDSNAVTILVRDHPKAIDVALTSKVDVANRILDEVIKLRRNAPLPT